MSLNVLAIMLAIQMTVVSSVNSKPLVEFSKERSIVSEADGSVKIDLSLSESMSDSIIITIMTDGGTAYGEGSGFYSKVKQKMIYGSGMDFHFESRRGKEVLKFKRGETTGQMVLSIIDDDIIEADETVEIVIERNENFNLGFRRKHIVTITDNDRKALANVVYFGAIGDGKSDDTEAIQKAVDYLVSKGGGVLFFPPLKTYLVTTIRLYKNISIYGYGATILRPPMQGKNRRTFISNYAGLQDSKPLIIKGITLDGNAENQGKFDEWELEQASLIFLEADKSMPGRNKVIIEDVLFRNGVGDAVTVYDNTQLLMFRSEAHDVFRGGFTVVGGHSITEVYDFKTRRTWNHSWGTGFDIETCCGGGYNDSWETDVIAEGLVLQDGDFDIIAYENSNIRMHDVKVMLPTYNLFEGFDAKMEFSNLNMKFSNKKGFRWPSNEEWTNCFIEISPESDYVHEGIASPESGSYGMNVYWDLSGKYDKDIKNQIISMKNTRFKPSELLKQSDETFVFKTHKDVLAFNNSIKLEQVHIQKGFDHGIISAGIVKLKDVLIDAKVPVLWGGVLELDGAVFQGENFLLIDRAAQKLTMKNVVLEQKYNVIDGDFEDKEIVGRRVIYGTSRPTLFTHAFYGDIYRIPETGKIKQWKCIRAGNSWCSGWERLPDEIQPKVSIEIVEDKVSEKEEKPGLLKISRSGDIREALAVWFDIDGTASLMEDFHFIPEVLIIPAGSYSQTMAITPVDDGDMEEDESVIISLRKGAGYSLGTNYSALLKILNHDVLSD